MVGHFGWGSERLHKAPVPPISNQVGNIQLFSNRPALIGAIQEKRADLRYWCAPLFIDDNPELTERQLLQAVHILLDRHVARQHHADFVGEKLFSGIVDHAAAVAVETWTDTGSCPSTASRGKTKRER